MAKARPLPTLVQMESRLGFIVDSLTYPDEMSDRFYSDLRLVPSSTYKRTVEEFEEHEKMKCGVNRRIVSEEKLSQMDVVTVGRFNHLRDLLTRRLENRARGRCVDDPVP